MPRPVLDRPDAGRFSIGSGTLKRQACREGQSLRTRQNGSHFADDIFKPISLNENAIISIEISLKFVPNGPNNNIPALVKIMAWHRQATSHYLNQWWLDNQLLYASLGFNELNRICTKGSYKKIIHILTLPPIITMTSQWARWRLKSPASRMFTQTLIRVQIKENIKAPRHWPLCGEFTQMASNAESVSIWWRHHVKLGHGWVITSHHFALL